MRARRIMLVVGVVFALIGGGAMFVVNTLFAPAPSFIVAARVDIPAGTSLTDISDQDLVTVPLQLKSSARPLLEAVLAPEDLERLRAGRGILIRDIQKHEPLPFSAVLAGENPAAGYLARLGLNDPDLILIVIPAQGTAPESISAGDRVDLAVAVGQVPDPIVLESDEMLPPPPSINNVGLGGSLPDNVLATLVSASRLPNATATETPTSTPTSTPVPEIREPLAKVLVHGAPVVRVIRERSLASISSMGDSSCATGDIIALEVVIPRDAFEMVSMAANAGVLEVGLLSPLAGDEVDGPTMGASLQDLLDLFYADRQVLAPTAAPSATGTPEVDEISQPEIEQSTQMP